MYGLRAEEALGRDAREMVTLKMSDEELAGAFREIAESGRLRAEQVQHREDGTPIYVDSLTIAMRDEQGERVVIEDVEKDARFEPHRRIAASAPQGGWDEMVEAIRGGRLEKIDPDRCREVVMERFSVEAMVDGYEKVFEKILALQSTSRAGQGKPATRAAS
jgi:hypothetical protein